MIHKNFTSYLTNISNLLNINMPMKLVIKLFIFVIISFIFCFCASKSEKSKSEGSSFLVKNIIITPNKPIILKGSKVNLEIIGLWNAYSVDSLFLFQTSEFPNSFLVYDATNFKFKGRIFKNGQGPNEFLSLDYFNQIEKQNTNISLWVLDHAFKKLRLVDLGNSLITKKTITRKEYSYHAELNNMYLINDTICICTNLIGPNLEFGYLNIVNSGFKSLFRILNFEVNKTIDIKYTSSCSTIKPDKTKFALSMGYFNQILIANTNGVDKFTISIGKPQSLSKVIENDKSQTQKTQFGVSCSTNNQIWTIYNNLIEKDFYSSATKCYSKILVLDWKGNPEYTLQTPQKLKSIFFNKNKDVLYGIDINEMIYKYQIKDFIK